MKGQGKDPTLPPLPEDFRFLVAKGGGSCGLIHFGVAIALSQLKILDNIDMVGGSSAGAIAALLIATGWPLEKIKAKLESLKLDEIANSESIWAIVWNVRHHFGTRRGEQLYQWFREIIKEVTGNLDATFLDWHNKKVEREKLAPRVQDQWGVTRFEKMKHLYVEACNMATGFNRVFSHTSDHKDVSIANAIRASMAYPGFFTSWFINGAHYSDGGLGGDCPVHLFSCESGRPNPKMLGVWIDNRARIDYILNNREPPEEKVSGIRQFFYTAAVALYNQQMEFIRKGEYRDKLIYCDTCGVDGLNFNLTPDQKKALIRSGIYGVVRYFYINHPEYTQHFFDNDLLEKVKAQKFPISIVDFDKEFIESFDKAFQIEDWLKDKKEKGQQSPDNSLTNKSHASIGKPNLRKSISMPNLSYTSGQGRKTDNVIHLNRALTESGTEKSDLDRILEGLERLSLNSQDDSGFSRDSGTLSILGMPKSPSLPDLLKAPNELTPGYTNSRKDITEGTSSTGSSSEIDSKEDTNPSSKGWGSYLRRLVGW